MLALTELKKLNDTILFCLLSIKIVRKKGAWPPIYLKVKNPEQIALETRARTLNPKFYESLLAHKGEGVRQIEAQFTNTLGWSATTNAVDPWVYQRLSETFVLDEDMRRRLADLNPQASARMANRLLEANDRNFWQPDEATLAALQDAADELEDRLEGLTTMAAE